MQAKERSIESLRDTLATTKRTYEGRLSQAEAALAVRDAEVGLGVDDTWPKMLDGSHGQRRVSSVEMLSLFTLQSFICRQLLPKRICARPRQSLMASRWELGTYSPVESVQK